MHLFNNNNKNIDILAKMSIIHIPGLLETILSYSEKPKYKL